MEQPETPSVLGDPRDNDLALGFLLATAHYNSRERLAGRLRPFGIEVRHFGVLSALDRHGPTSQRHLSELLDLDKSAMVRIMDELERSGLATRNRSAHDRRAYAIELTGEGRARLHAARAEAAVAGEELFGWLRPADRGRLVALLEELVARIDRPTGN
ncbi:MarR family winged helix-turn-helix transcriptional regulator [Spirillospora sp. NPDC048911]|uniref:MarR family winged helix-turn-helix transcriptional regulator n=1 Tax=Spirillospora sp. NPDC048911 TaxID=3364527 RepID=UPI00371383DA